VPVNLSATLSQISTTAKMAAAKRLWLPVGARRSMVHT
jgi:hypothetical protein